MKKYILLILLSASPMIWANDGGRSCVELKIIVQNSTNTSCYLLSTDLNRGFYGFGYKIPGGKIAPGESHSFIFEQLNYSGTEVVLSYECGNGELTFKSQKALCIQGGAITGTLLAASNMNATYETSLGNYWKKIRGSIRWTLSDK